MWSFIERGGWNRSSQGRMFLYLFLLLFSGLWPSSLLFFTLASNFWRACQEGPRRTRGKTDSQVSSGGNTDPTYLFLFCTSYVKFLPEARLALLAFFLQLLLWGLVQLPYSAVDICCVYPGRVIRLGKKRQTENIFNRYESRVTKLSTRQTSE